MAKKKRTAGSPDAKLEDLKTYIKKVMKDAGIYRPELTYQVESAASTMQIFRMIRDEIIMNNEPPIIKEASREGDERRKANPIFYLYKEYNDLLMRNLRSLNMNKELTKGKDEKDAVGVDSPLAKLMKDIGEEDEED